MDGGRGCVRLLEVPDRRETKYAIGEGGLRIAYQAVGAGPRDIVLLTGGCVVDALVGDPVLDAALDRLERWGRVIRLDWRGFGSSDPLALGTLPTAEDWLDDLQVVLNEVDCTRAHLVGRSADGAMALLFAAMHPERVATVTVVDSFARVERDRDFMFGAPASAIDALAVWVENSWGSTAYGELEVPSRIDDEQFQRSFARANRLTFSPATAAAMFRWVGKVDIRSALSSVRAPTLVIHSARSAVLRVEHGRYLARNVPDARLVVRDGYSNFLLSRPDCDEVLDQIEEFVTGVRPVHDEARVFAAILFTDFVESTPKLVELGDTAWRELLDRHDLHVEHELSRYRGRKVKWTGDGLLATFDGPARAVRCARALIDAVRPLGIELRAGVHAGEVELRNGDIGGISVHIGQRISAMAGPGEVLVSRTITDLVAGSGLRFTARGECELKGVAEAWQLYALRD
jgi:class 3 adenylate cyclase